MEGISSKVVLVEDGRAACVEFREIRSGNFMQKRSGGREDERFDRFYKVDFSVRASLTKVRVYKKFKMTANT